MNPNTRVLTADKFVTIDSEDNKVDPAEFREFRITLKPMQEHNKSLKLEETKLE